MNELYPQNLLKRIYEDDFDTIWQNWNERKNQELEKTISELSPLQKMIIDRRFKGEDTLENIGNEMRVTRERVRQLESKTVRHIRQTKFCRDVARACGFHSDIKYLDLTQHAYNILRHYGYDTVEDIKTLVKSGKLKELHGAGEKTIENIRRCVDT